MEQLVNEGHYSDYEMYEMMAKHVRIVFPRINSAILTDGKDWTLDKLISQVEHQRKDVGLSPTITNPRPNKEAVVHQVGSFSGTNYDGDRDYAGNEGGAGGYGAGRQAPWTDSKYSRGRGRGRGRGYDRGRGGRGKGYKGYKGKGGKGRGKGQWGRGYNREQPPEVLTHKKHHCTECDHAGDVPKGIVKSHDRQFCTRPGQPFHGRPIAEARQAQSAADKKYLAGMVKVHQTNFGDGAEETRYGDHSGWLEESAATSEAEYNSFEECQDSFANQVRIRDSLDALQGAASKKARIYAIEFFVDVDNATAGLAPEATYEQTGVQVSLATPAPSQGLIQTDSGLSYFHLLHGVQWYPFGTSTAHQVKMRVAKKSVKATKAGPMGPVAFKMLRSDGSYEYIGGDGHVGINDDRFAQADLPPPTRAQHQQRQDRPRLQHGQRRAGATLRH